AHGIRGRSDGSAQLQPEGPFGSLVGHLVPAETRSRTRIEGWKESASYCLFAPWTEFVTNPVQSGCPYMTQPTSFTSPAGRTGGNSPSSSAAVAADGSIWGVSDICCCACSDLSSRRIFPFFSLNRNVRFCPPPSIASTRKTRPQESV